MQRRWEVLKSKALKIVKLHLPTLEGFKDGVTGIMIKRLALQM